MLDRAKERTLFKQLLVHDLESFPYPADITPGSFDVVVCVGVMDFIQRPREFVTYINQFMRPHQSLLFEAGSDDKRQQNTKTFTSTLPMSVLGITLPERHTHSDLSSFSRSEMERLLRDAGFYIERHERFTGYQDSKSGLVQYYHGWLCVLAHD